MFLLEDWMIAQGGKRNAQISEVEECAVPFYKEIARFQRYAKKTPVPSHLLEYVAEVEDFISQHRAGDDLIFFKTDFENHHYEGFILNRDNREVARIVTSYLISEYMG